MAQLTRIGNSFGIRIPKPIIEMAGLAGRDLELKVVDDGLLLSPLRPVRQGWKEAFRSMRNTGDDKLVLPDALHNRFDEDEWEW
jgi:antitoxin MazE